MDTTILFLVFSLVEKACLVIVVFCLLSYARFFIPVLRNKPTVWNQVVLAVVFGILAIYGTYSGVKTTGAIANIRNLGPMLGGFLGGPWVGLAAGIIGGVHRYFMGGFTAVPCAIGTVLAGLLAGILFKLMKDNIGIWRPTLYAFVMEAIDMGLLLLIARPFNDAWSLVQVIGIPMIVADTIGVAIFAFILANMKKRIAA